MKNVSFKIWLVGAISLIVVIWAGLDGKSYYQKQHRKADLTEKIRDVEERMEKSKQAYENYQKATQHSVQATREGLDTLEKSQRDFQAKYDKTSMEMQNLMAQSTSVGQIEAMKISMQGMDKKRDDVMAQIKDGKRICEETLAKDQMQSQKMKIQMAGLELEHQILAEQLGKIK